MRNKDTPEVYSAGEINPNTECKFVALQDYAALKEEFDAFKLATAETAQAYIERIDSLKEENERLKEARLAPVLYQYRMRPTWKKDSKFGEWDECSEASYVQYQNQRIYGDWEYQSRALYSSAPDLDALKARVAVLEKASK